MSGLNLQHKDSPLISGIIYQSNPPADNYLIKRLLEVNRRDSVQAPQHLDVSFIISPGFLD
jgi:hypothetical protein